MSEIKECNEEAFNLIDWVTSSRDKGHIVWIFNIGTEKFWNSKDYTIKDTAEETVVNHIEDINLLLTRSDDIMIMRQRPSEAFLDNLKNLGFEVPNIVCPKEGDATASISELLLNDDVVLSYLKDNNSVDTVFVPYGISYLEEDICKKTGLHRNGATIDLIKIINDKMFARNLAKDLGMEVTEGYACFSLEDLSEKYVELARKYEKVIIKQCFGASGKGLYVVKNEREFKSATRILKHLSKSDEEKKWLIEGWYDKMLDLNYQIYVDETGDVNVFSIKEQLLEETVYTGSLMPPRISDEMTLRIRDAGEKIGKALFEQGFHGVLGVDAFITKDNVLIPIIEINARFTLSTYISFLKDKFKDKYLLAFYERINLLKGDSYETIEELFSDISCKSCADDGIFIYVSSTLNDINEKHRGRLFAVAVADSYEEAFKFKETVVERLRFRGRKNGK